jgi:hypothetical protein
LRHGQLCTLTGVLRLRISASAVTKSSQAAVGPRVPLWVATSGDVVESNVQTNTTPSLKAARQTTRQGSFKSSPGMINVNAAGIQSLDRWSCSAAPDVEILRIMRGVLYPQARSELA